MPVDLYYYPPSMPCSAVRMIAKGIGIHLNLKLVNMREGDYLKSDFVKINPQHTIPTIDDNGFVLWESRAIMGYFVDRYAKDDSYYPKDPQRRAMVDQRLYFDRAILDTAFRKAYILWLFGLEDSVSEENLIALEKAFEVLNTFLEENNFVAGETLTIADISMITIVAAAEAVGFDPKRWENVCGWYERCQGILKKFDYDEICGTGTKILHDMVKSRQS